MDYTKVLQKVQKLIALAEHEGTPPEEAKRAREQADAMMLKYAIDEITAEAAMPVGERQKPIMVDMNIGVNSDIIQYVAGILTQIASHTRCKVRHYTKSARNEHGQLEYMSTVYGYESDVKYCEVLYTTVRLHMLGLLLPKPDPAKSEDENAYALHYAGFNWLEIAGIYGWRKQTYSGRIQREHERGHISDDLYDKYEAGKAEVWYNERSDSYQSNWQLGSSYKRACHRQAKKLGEKVQRIPAGGSKGYRQDAANGYFNMIGMRLSEIRRSRKAGAEVALAGRVRDLEKFFREQNPAGYTRCQACGELSANPYVCDVCGAKIADPPKAKPAGRYRYSVTRTRDTNMTAYRMGSDHARTADLTGGARGTGSAKKGEIS